MLGGGRDGLVDHLLLGWPNSWWRRSLVWAVLDRASRGWRGLTMTPKGLRLLQDLRRQLLHPPMPKEVFDQAVTAAA
jgi:hypothetical protein